MGGSQVPFQHILDQEGRYVILFGNLDGEEMCLMNVYAPDIDCVEFYSGVVSAAVALLAVDIVLAGDGNCVIGGELEKPHITGQLADLLQELKLLDPRRQMHLKSMEYSCFTTGTYS
ncbi:hypothetical protein NDU88_005900 [Pleurodeles waltl]|uniref:Uncharacterized protein n=1 Tax=Pleurodeles waltl TaxID=8319 RepID=A0AAV7WW03_PLEWA|nr:hypothetical protein NDU88_005900 [Pleurodeles waltl]